MISKFKHFITESKKKKSTKFNATPQDLWNCFEGILDLEDYRDGGKLAFYVRPVKYNENSENIEGSFQIKIIKPITGEDRHMDLEDPGYLYHDRGSNPFIMTQDMIDEISSSIGKSQEFNLRLIWIYVDVQTSRKGSYDGVKCYNTSQFENLLGDKVSNMRIMLSPR